MLQEPSGEDLESRVSGVLTSSCSLGGEDSSDGMAGGSLIFFSYLAPSGDHIRELVGRRIGCRKKGPGTPSCCLRRATWESSEGSMRNICLLLC